MTPADPTPGAEELLFADHGASSRPYRVLARKYRPGRFSELVGQQALVETMTNAFASGRLAQAWMLTGVRGTGKTSTARILARALNCIGPDGRGGPTVDPCGVCSHCVDIAEGRHIDVVEMDAASNTGVDNMREVIEAVRYASVSARTKVYIIDEVHMLSKGAFNALLKTLEEPPPHVKFVLATTEVGKVPPTILSRCQRFDLRRVPPPELAAHLGRVAAAEGVEAEDEALDLVARAAGGSVRDALSLFDQAIALSSGRVVAGAVRRMLGLVEQERTEALLALLLAGDAAGAIAGYDEAIARGDEPHALLSALLDRLHALTRAAAGAPAPAAASADARALGMAGLQALWQLALKGLADLAHAPDAIQAGAMAVLRLAYAAPWTSEPAAARPAAPAQAAEAQAPGAAAPAAAGATAGMDLATLEAIARRCADETEASLAHWLSDEATLVSLEPGRLVLAVARPGEPAERRRAQQLAQCLSRWTDQRWAVSLADGSAAAGETLRQVELRRTRDAEEAATAHPVVAAVLAASPGARLTGVRAAEI